MYGNVLLIGGTGYLGSHIAYEFLKQNSGDLYCLIRSKNNVATRYRLLQSLRFYFGNDFVSKMSDRIKVVSRRYSKQCWIKSFLQRFIRSCKKYNDHN